MTRQRQISTTLASVFLAVSLGACGGPAGESTKDASQQEAQSTAEAPSEEAAPADLTAEEALEALRSQNGHVTDVLVWDESTDINEMLGRPGQYISKADFSDDRVEETWETEEERMASGLQGGTLETFESESDCDGRCEYLKKFMNSEMGAFGLNQYVYKYPKAILRVSYSIIPSEAEVYKSQMDSTMGCVSEEILPEN